MQRQGRGVPRIGNMSSSASGFDSDEEEEEEEEEASVSGDGANDDEVPSLDDSGRLRLRPDIALDGENYAGRKSSRKAVLEGEEEDTDAEAEAEAEVEAHGLELRKRLRAVQTGGERSSSADGDDDEEWERTGGPLLDTVGQDDELEALSKEYEKLREEEEQELEIVRAQTADDRSKGRAVADQKALWDRALEFRISLQKTLTDANRLPGKQVRESLSLDNGQIRDSYSKLIDSATRTLSSLLELETLLTEKNNAITESYSGTVNANGKREAGEDGREEESASHKAWDALDGLYSQIVPFRDSTLDRWQRKAQIFTGAVAKVKLRAFNQSISQQVGTTMRDSSRLIARTKMKRGSVHILGQPAAPKTVKAVADNGAMEDSANSDPAHARDVSVSAEDELDPETFEDTEFYQQLLRELLESLDPSAPGGMGIYASARQQTKKRKKVDRRASKGRKLRYNVFDPLLNFMAPKPMVLPPMATQLFSNLFGQKTAAPSSLS